MPLAILCLNCQHDYRRELGPFLRNTLASECYDFILLQEVDEKVLEHLRGIEAYKVLTIFNQKRAGPECLAIAYRRRFTLRDQAFHSFASMYGSYREAGFGFLTGSFEVTGQNIVIGSAHLHALLLPRVRAAEARMIKEILEKEKSPVIFGGDFNTILFGEAGKIERLLAPQLVRLSAKAGATLNSRYTQFGTVFLSRAAYLLGRLGIGLSVAADHIYASNSLVSNRKIICRTLPDRVSDHSPIGLVIE